MTAAYRIVSAGSLSAAQQKAKSYNKQDDIVGQRLGANDSPLMPPTLRHISYDERRAQPMSATALPLSGPVQFHSRRGRTDIFIIPH